MKATIKRLTAIFCFTALLVGMTACDNSSSAPTSSKNGQEQPDAQSEQYKISVIVNTLSSEYWGYVTAGARAYQTDHPNIQVEINGPPSETAYDEQLNMIETVLTSGEYDGMVVSPLQAESTAVVIENADIPIVSMNTPIESDVIMTHVGTGNEAAASEGGKAAVEAAKAAGWDEISAIAIAGTQGDPAGGQRLTGFQKGIESAGGTFLADETQYADWTADKAVSAMEAIMQKYPNGIAIIVACNDDMAMAAARAAKGIEAFQNTIFCGFDGNQSACESILNGDLTMSVAQDPFNMGYTAVDCVIKAIQQEPLDSFVDTGCSIVTRENAQERLDTLKDY